MSGRSPFSKLKGRPQSMSAANISFRFNPLDEELEEISCEEKEVPPASAEKKYEAKHSVEAGKNDSEGEICKETNGIHEKSETSQLLASESDDSESINDLSKSEDASKESLKGYLSKFGRRACSLDSETEASTEKEVWPFIKDLSGRITKNIEECIAKDVKGLVTEGEIAEGVPLLEDAGDSQGNLRFSSSLSASDFFPDKSRISPSVEVTESLEELDITNYLASGEKVNVEKKILNEPVNEFVGEKQTVPPPSPTLPKTKKTVPTINMSLSSLMANRNFSFEEQETKNAKKEESKESAVIASETSGSESSIHKPDPTSKLRQGQFWNIFLQTHSYYRFLTSVWNRTVSYIVVAVLACLIVPIPSLMSGFFIGVILSSTFMYWLMKPAPVRETFTLPDYNKLPRLAIDTKEQDDESILFKGWMNELPSEYNPNTYHVNCTNSVYIRLDSSYLRVSYPKANIPKRAMFNHPRPELVFIDQDVYEISNLLSIELLPEGLSEKRRWIKKYPICLTFSDAKHSLHRKALTSKAQSSKESPVKKHRIVNENGDHVLYLFARTDRDKDDWYRRFLKVSRIKILKSHSPSSTPNIVGLESDTLENKRAISVDLGSLQQLYSFSNISSVEKREEDEDVFTMIKFDKQLNFEYYMSQLLSRATGSPQAKKPLIRSKPDLLDCKSSGSSAQNSTLLNLLWLNALIGRAFFDFLNENFWANVVAERIQRKLSKIKLPHFMDELKVTGIKLGSALPKINRASDPVVDQKGLWVDLDISYDGSFEMTLETKLNLRRLQKGDSDTISTDSKERELEDMNIRSRVYRDDEEDTAESSSDDDVPMPEMGLNSPMDESSSTSLASASKGGKKLFRFVDKIAQSSYFQTAAKNKYVKRAIEEVSKTPLVLTVEVCWLTGTLAVNFPPIPSNRIWYGFRKNPNLSIVARPKLGCRAVTITHITEWIEKKLVLEFQKVLVMPNMDDLIIPIMQSKSESK